MASHHTVLDAGVRTATRSRPRRLLGAGLAALAIAGVVGLLRLRPGPPRAEDARAIAAPSVSVPEAAPPAAPPAPAPAVVRNVNEAIPVATTTVREPTNHDRARPNRRRKPERSKPAPVPPSAQAPVPPRTNCSPNYYVDAQGDKHFKPDCFLEKKPGP